MDVESEKLAEELFVALNASIASPGNGIARYHASSFFVFTCWSLDYIGKKER